MIDVKNSVPMKMLKNIIISIRLPGNLRKMLPQTRNIKTCGHMNMFLFPLRRGWN